jgi:hypothetical protein
MVYRVKVKAMLMKPQLSTMSLDFASSVLSDIFVNLKIARAYFDNAQNHDPCIVIIEIREAAKHLTNKDPIY